MILDELRNQCEIPVRINKVIDTKLLWRSRSAFGHQNLSDEEFLETYSWVIKDSFFRSVNQISNEQSVGTAERYGGIGISTNGGGARVVNFSGAQLKGVGANQLAGNDTPSSHSYGGLDIQGAAKEIIYSAVLNRISPVGAQQVHGMIYLDSHSAVHEGTPSPAVILIREQCIRMGQFLPCRDFREKPEFAGSIKADHHRILSLYKMIDGKIGLSEFYIMLQNFLDKSADQLSFLKFAKLSHNALTPSNISTDGRLLDTSTCSFVLAGSNFGQLTCVMEEPEVPTLVISEILYLINKYSLRNEIGEHLTKLYREKYQQYMWINAGFVLAIERDISIRLSSLPAWKKFSHMFHSLVLVGCAEKTHSLPTSEAKDLANEMLSGSLFALFHRLEVPENLKFMRDLSLELKIIFKAAYGVFEGLFVSRHIFLTSIFIQILKRAYLSSFFYITYIGHAIDESCKYSTTEETVKIIKCCEDTADWIYESVSSEVTTIYLDSEKTLFYKRSDGKIYFKLFDCSPIEIGTFSDLRNFVSNSTDKYIIMDYDFKSFIEKICAFFCFNKSQSFNGVKDVFL